MDSVMNVLEREDIVTWDSEAGFFLAETKTMLYIIEEATDQLLLELPIEQGKRLATVLNRFLHED